MVSEMIIRNDDVSSNTDPHHLDELYRVIRNFQYNCEIWSGITFFSRYAKSGAVYPDLPLKDQPLEYLLNVDQVRTRISSGCSTVVSHGLWHFDHTKVDQELAEASILSSCRLLHTDIFVPPFNKWSPMIEYICKKHSIKLVKSTEEGWKSFEYNEFNPHFNRWYFHSWKWTPDALADYLQKSLQKSHDILNR